MQILTLLLIISAFASEENTAQDSILVKIEEEVYNKEKTKSSKYIGSSYSRRDAVWRAWRYSKNQKIKIYNGHNYKDDETAAHASDTLARKLIANGEEGHKLNFPGDDTEVYPEKTSNYIGVTYIKKQAIWRAERKSKNRNTVLCNGHFKNEDTAAHASDTLARKLIANGEKQHKLNFPDDATEVSKVHPEKISSYIGVSYNKKESRWYARRWSKNEKKLDYNGYHKDEETAAHASDTLARKLIANGEKGHKLNFPDITEYQNNKRKRPASFENYDD